jgi:hypothetical protein
LELRGSAHDSVVIETLDELQQGRVETRILGSYRADRSVQS